MRIPTVENVCCNLPANSPSRLPTRRTWWHAAVQFSMILLLAAPGHALAAMTSEPKTNLAVIRDLAEAIGQRIGILTDLPAGDTLSVSVRPSESAWYIQSSLIRGISGSSRPVRSSDKGPVTAECGIEEILVSYSDPRTDGLLGSTIVDREVSVTISTMLIDQVSGTILLNDELLEERTDTIELGDIGTLENPNIPATQGSLPAEGFFSNIAGPLILIGSIGVAVFLLFHVRS